ncbi:MAG: hypothetical protein PHZ25_00175 [Candidatus Pacebacteria bacterium]|nr:hypothetical protein [Candidatus Paceibacterota bacterium]
MEKIIEQLKNLKSIIPDKNFSEKSRFLILSSNRKLIYWMPNQISEIFRYLTAISLTSVLIILILGGFNYLEKSNLPMIIAGLDLKTLEAEAESLGIDINISKLAYYQESNQTVKTALNQTIKDDPVYFEEVILNKETNLLKLEDPTNKNIDKALNEILN